MLLFLGLRAVVMYRSFISLAILGNTVSFDLVNLSFVLFVLSSSLPG